MYLCKLVKNNPFSISHFDSGSTTLWKGIILLLYNSAGRHTVRGMSRFLQKIQHTEWLQKIV